MLGTTFVTVSSCLVSPSFTSANSIWAAHSLCFKRATSRESLISSYVARRKTIRGHTESDSLTWTGSNLLTTTSLSWSLSTTLSGKSPGIYLKLHRLLPSSASDQLGLRRIKMLICMLGEKQREIRLNQSTSNLAGWILLIISRIYTGKIWSAFRKLVSMK